MVEIVRSQTISGVNYFLSLEKIDDPNIEGRYTLYKGTDLANAEYIAEFDFSVVPEEERLGINLSSSLKIREIIHSSSYELEEVVELLKPFDVSEDFWALETVNTVDIDISTNNGVIDPTTTPDPNSEAVEEQDNETVVDIVDVTEEIDLFNDPIGTSGEEATEDEPVTMPQSLQREIPDFDPNTIRLSSFSNLEVFSFDRAKGKTYVLLPGQSKVSTSLYSRSIYEVDRQTGNHRFVTDLKFDGAFTDILFRRYQKPQNGSTPEPQPYVFDSSTGTLMNFSLKTGELIEKFSLPNRSPLTVKFDRKGNVYGLRNAYINGNLFIELVKYDAANNYQDTVLGAYEGHSNQFDIFIGRKTEDLQTTEFLKATIVYSSSNEKEIIKINNLANPAVFSNRVSNTSEILNLEMTSKQLEEAYVLDSSEFVDGRYEIGGSLKLAESNPTTFHLYEFDLEAKSKVDLTLSGLTGDHVLRLYDQWGNLIEESDDNVVLAESIYSKSSERVDSLLALGKLDNENIERVLEPGKYYIQSSLKHTTVGKGVGYNLSVDIDPLEYDLSEVLRVNSPYPSLMTFTIPEHTEQASFDYRFLDGGTSNISNNPGGEAGTLIFEPGETQKSIALPEFQPQDRSDYYLEDRARFYTLLSNPNNVLFSTDNSATLLIEDRYPVSGSTSGEISLSLIGFNGLNQERIFENAGGIEFTIGIEEFSLSRLEEGEAVTIGYSTFDGTGKSGEDYTETSGQLTFSADEPTQSILLPLIDDSLNEGVETFYLNFTNESGNASLGNIQHTKIEIHDNDPLSFNGLGIRNTYYEPGFSLSSDGKTIAFAGRKSLVEEDTDSIWVNNLDVYVFDKEEGDFNLVTVLNDGTKIDGHNPAISGDGNTVIFESAFKNDLFVHQRDLGTTVPLGIAEDLGTTFLYIEDFGLNTDGTLLSYSLFGEEYLYDLDFGESYLASDYYGFGTDTPVSFHLMPHDDGLNNLFSYNSETQILTKISNSYDTDNEGNPNYELNQPIDSFDVTEGGDYVLFTSEASNIVPNDTNGARDAFVYDVEQNSTYRVSVDEAGNQFNRDVDKAVLSDDGQTVALLYGDDLTIRDLSDIKHDNFVNSATVPNDDEFNITWNEKKFKDANGNWKEYGKSINDAVKFWEDIIVQGLPDQYDSKTNTVIDDLHIEFSVDDLTKDFLKRLLFTSPDASTKVQIRESNKLPYLATIVFDSSNYDDEDFLDTAIHEIGHAIGFASETFDGLGLVTNVSLSGGVGYGFIGDRAIDEYRKMSYGLAKHHESVPLESKIVNGSSIFSAHWHDELFPQSFLSEDALKLIPDPLITINSELNSELMVDRREKSFSGDYVLSNLTVAALEDIGYVVNRSSRHINTSLGVYPYDVDYVIAEPIIVPNEPPGFNPIFGLDY